MSETGNKGSSQKKQPIDLSGLKKDEKRGKDRALINSPALVIDLVFGNKTYKGTVRNISPGGVGFEVTKANFAVGNQAMIEFGGTLAHLNVGTIKCTIQWIKPVEKQPDLQLLGFKYSDDLSESKKKKITDYLAKLIEENIWR